MTRPWHTGDTRWLVANYRTLGTKACATHLHRSVPAVRSAAGRLGCRQRQRLASPLLIRIRKLHSCGMHDADIAAELDIARTTVTKWRNRAGLPPNRRPGRINHALRCRVLALHDAGKTTAEIGVIVGRARVNVWRMLRRLGAPMNTRGKRICTVAETADATSLSGGEEEEE